MSVERKPKIYTTPDNIDHPGEIIELPNGITGYVEWNSGLYSSQELKTARMKMAGRRLHRLLLQRDFEARLRPQDRRMPLESPPIFNAIS